MPQGMIPTKALDPFIDGIKRLEAKVEKLEHKNNALVSVLSDIVEIHTADCTALSGDDEERLLQLYSKAERIIKE